MHATGEIQAKVWYTGKKKIDLKQIKNERTGKIENKYSIKFNNFQINLYKTLTKFEKYDTIEANKKVKIFSNLYLPIEIIKKTNYETVESKITYGNEEAKNIGIEKLSEELENQIEDKNNILQKYINSYASNDSIEVELTYEVLENIGTKEKIVF